MSKPRLTAAELEGKYPIALAARMTAIPAETLRIWERRYGVPKPKRAAGGSRLYSDDDIALLRLVARAIDQGHRPQSLLGRSRDELADLMRTTDASAPPRGAAVAAGGGSRAPTVSSALDAVADDDAARLRADLRRAALAMGPRRFVVEFAQPLLERVGDLWAEGKLAVRQEHLASECLATQLRVLLSDYEDLSHAPVVLLTTLPDELHSLGLLMVAVYLAVAGAAPRMLGPIMPVSEIREAARALRADVVGITVAGSFDQRTAERQLRELRSELPRRVRLWVGGGGATTLRLPDKTQRVMQWSELDRVLAIDAA